MHIGSMSFLLHFFGNRKNFKYSDFDYPLSTFEKITDIFRSEKSIKSDPRIGIPLVLGKNYPDLFEDLGFLDLPIEPHEGAKAQKISDSEILGWAIEVVSIGHVIFELGDSKHHVRVDMKETWLGHRLAYQIDQMTLWDKDYIYDIPCAEGGNPIPLENVIGVIDITVQALQNGDDHEGAFAFEGIKDVKVILPRSPQNRLKTNSLANRNTP